jgi:cytochrome d ubiquinol oxidase subunit I
VVPAAVATTLTAFVIVYSLLLVAFLWYAARVVRMGPPPLEGGSDGAMRPTRTVAGATGTVQPAE